MNFLRILAIFSVLVVLTVGCSSADKYDTSTAEGAFKQAEDFEKDERYEEAVAKYTDVKNKFPYSKLAPQAELKIADVQYKREAYIEAQTAYQLFKEFHPKHPQADYVTFRLAMSYFNQLPTSIDRDLSVADKAILYFDELVNSYATSQYVAEAKQKKTETLTMQAKKELYVADFYTRREKFDSALKRYETVLKLYVGLGLEPVALFGAANAALKAGERDKATQFLDTLYNKFPNSDQARRAKNEFK